MRLVIPLIVLACSLSHGHGFSLAAGIEEPEKRTVARDRLGDVGRTIADRINHEWKVSRAGSWRWRIGVFPPKLDLRSTEGRDGSYIEYNLASEHIVKSLEAGLDPAIFDVHANEKLADALSKGNRQPGQYDPTNFDPTKAGSIYDLCVMAGLDFVVFGTYEMHPKMKSETAIKIALTVVNIDKYTRLPEAGLRRPRDSERTQFTDRFEMGHKDWRDSTGTYPYAVRDGEGALVSPIKSVDWGTRQFTNFRPDEEVETKQPLYLVARKIARSFKSFDRKKRIYLAATSEPDRSGQSVQSNSLTDLAANCLSELFNVEFEHKNVADIDKLNTFLSKEMNRNFVDLEAIVDTGVDDDYEGSQAERLDRLLLKRKALGVIWLRIDKIQEGFYGVKALIYQPGDGQPGEMWNETFGTLKTNDVNRRYLTELVSVENTKARSLNNLSGNREIKLAVEALSTRLANDDDVLSELYSGRLLSIGSFFSKSQHSNLAILNEFAERISERRDELEKNFSSRFDGAALVDKLDYFEKTLQIGGVTYPNLISAERGFEDFEARMTKSEAGRFGAAMGRLARTTLRQALKDRAKEDDDLAEVLDKSRGFGATIAEIERQLRVLRQRLRLRKRGALNKTPKAVSATLGDLRLDGRITGNDNDGTIELTVTDELSADELASVNVEISSRFVPLVRDELKKVAGEKLEPKSFDIRAK